MMQLIRDKAQGIVSWIIVAIIAIVFGSVGISYMSPTSNVLAKVRGEQITNDEVDNVYNKWLRYISVQKGFNPAQLNPELIKRQITKSLAEQLAFIGSLTGYGFGVSNQVLLQSIKNDPEFQEDEKFSLEKYKHYLAQLDLSETQFEKLRRNELMANQAQHLVVDTSFASKAEVERLVAIQNQRRSFSYIVVPAAKYAAAIKVSDAEVADYYAKNKHLFVLPEKIKLEYIELSMDDIANNQANEQQLRDYYTKNIQLFAEPELLHVRHILVGADDKKKIDQIYNDLKSGSSFVELAKKDSIDKPTANNGGDLGWITKNDEYPEEVWALKNVNDFTPVVKTEFGWHIFQLAQRKGGKAKDFSEVRKIVEQRYRRENAERLFASKNEELANLTFENPNSLEVASEKLGLPIKTTADYFGAGGGAGITGLPEVLAAAFSEPVLIQKHNSEPIRISDDSYVVIRVKDRQEQRQQDLPEVREQVIKALQLIGAHAKAKELADQTLVGIKNGKTPAQDWKTYSNIGRNDKNINAELLQRAFAVAKPTAANPVIAMSFDLPNGDYAVIALNKVIDGKLEANVDSGMHEMIAKQVATLEGNLQYALLQVSLITKAKIDYK